MKAQIYLRQVQEYVQHIRHTLKRLEESHIFDDARLSYLRDIFDMLDEFERTAHYKLHSIMHDGD